MTTPYLIEKLFPRECVSCREIGSYLCTSCKKKLYVHPEICPFCHKDSRNFQTCFSCKKEEDVALEWVVIAFAYQDIMKKLLLKIKFYHKYDVGEFLIQRLSLILQTLPNFLQQKNIIISFIPSHWRRRYLEKGYNQSELLAKELANQLSFPMIPVAKKVKYTASQVKLNKKERQKNLNHAFTLLGLENLPLGTTLLLVDDILTTGTTLNTLAKIIKKTRPDLKIRGTVIARNMR